MFNSFTSYSLFLHIAFEMNSVGNFSHDHLRYNITVINWRATYSSGAIYIMNTTHNILSSLSADTEIALTV